MTLHPEYIVDKQGRRKKVLLSMKEYKELLELTQDIIDARLIEEAKNEPRVPWEQVKEKLKKKQAK